MADGLLLMLSCRIVKAGEPSYFRAFGISILTLAVTLLAALVIGFVFVVLVLAIMGIHYSEQVYSRLNAELLLLIPLFIVPLRVVCTALLVRPFLKVTPGKAWQIALVRWSIDLVLLLAVAVFLFSSGKIVG